MPALLVPPAYHLPRVRDHARAQVPQQHRAVGRHPRGEEEREEAAVDRLHPPQRQVPRRRCGRVAAVAGRGACRRDLVGLASGATRSLARLTTGVWGGVRGRRKLLASGCEVGPSHLPSSETEDEVGGQDVLVH